MTKLSHKDALDATTGSVKKARVMEAAGELNESVLSTQLKYEELSTYFLL